MYESPLHPQDRSDSSPQSVKFQASAADCDALEAWRTFEPNVHRQRFIIEGHYPPNKMIGREDMSTFLLLLSDELGMTPLLPEPIITSATEVNPEHAGYEGHIIWVESGAQVYNWEKHHFLTVDIYTCKSFELQRALNFVQEYFELVDYQAKEV